MCMLWWSYSKYTTTRNLRAHTIYSKVEESWLLFVGGLCRCTVSGLNLKEEAKVPKFHTHCQHSHMEKWKALQSLWTLPFLCFWAIWSFTCPCKCQQCTSPQDFISSLHRRAFQLKKWIPHICTSVFSQQLFNEVRDASLLPSCWVTASSTTMLDDDFDLLCYRLSNKCFHY